MSKSATAKTEVKKSDNGKTIYFSLSVDQIMVGKELTFSVYLCINHKMVKYKPSGESFDAVAYDRIINNHVRFLFVEEKDRKLVETWSMQVEAVENEITAEQNKEVGTFAETTSEARRAMMDLFLDPRDDKNVLAAIDAAKKLVTEFLRKPFSVKNIQVLQKYSKGCVDHSVNVAVLSVFLGLRMGYSHQVILENLALAGLFHDIGKTLIEGSEGSLALGSDQESASIELEQHPKLGREYLEKIREIPNEVLMMVAQHHEYMDGSGYPAKLKGMALYDLARIVVISNLFDQLISESNHTTMKDRTEEALSRLQSEFEDKLDAKKLEKSLKILQYSLS